MSLDQITIIKSSGEREPWSTQKLERSLHAAQASDELTKDFILHIDKDVQDRSEERRVGKECRFRW